MSSDMLVGALARRLKKAFDDAADGLVRAEISNSDIPFGEAVKILRETDPTLKVVALEEDVVEVLQGEGVEHVASLDGQLATELRNMP